MRNSSFIFLFVLLCQGAKTNAQCNGKTVNAISTFAPLAIDSIVESAGLRNGPDYNGATIYFPTGSGVHKSIVLVPGFTATQSSIAPWARFFASRGYVCMTIGTNSLIDLPDIRAKALIDAMQTIREENLRSASPLFSKLDTNNIAVGGWSMGGGGAQLAAVLEPRVKLVFAITPWLEVAKVNPAYLLHSKPILILSGEIDPTAPPASYANIHYANTPGTTNKMIYEVKGGNHNTPLDPTTGSGDLGNVAFAWMNLYLNDDDCYCPMLKDDSLNQHTSSSDFQTNINCSSTSIANLSSNKSLKYYPNPCQNSFVIEQNSTDKTPFQIINPQGQQVTIGTTTGYSTNIDVSDLAAGMYFLKTKDQVFSFVKQ